MHPNVHSSSILVAKTWKHPKCPSTDEYTHTHTHTLEYDSAIKKSGAIVPFTAMWMDLEIRKVTSQQRKTNTIFLMESKRIQMSLFTKQTQK